MDELLQKLGIKKGIEDLTQEERATFLSWQQILSSKDISIEDLKKFLPEELERARTELEKWDNSEKRELFYKALAHLTGVMLRFISTPAIQRDQLRSHIQKQFNIDI